MIECRNAGTSLVNKLKCNTVCRQLFNNFIYGFKCVFNGSIMSCFSLASFISNCKGNGFRMNIQSDESCGRISFHGLPPFVKMDNTIEPYYILLIADQMQFQQAVGGVVSLRGRIGWNEYRPALCWQRGRMQ